MELEKGFVNVYRNFETGKTAFAWIFEDERIFGADNTGKWHIHPFKNPNDHKKSESISLQEFVGRIEEFLNRKKS